MTYRKATPPATDIGQDRLRRRSLLGAGALVAGTAALGISPHAHAQTFPSRAISLVVGFPPGGSNDIVARILAPRLGELLGVPVVVVNKPGSNALIGTDFVARSAPDGYTITLASASPLVISPNTYSKMPFDPIKDLTGITSVAATPELIAVHPSVPANTLQELVALSRTREISLSSSGNGGLPHLAIELLRTATSGRFLHVPYRGAGPAVTDTAGGHVNGVIMDLPALLGMVKEGKLRPLAITNKERSPALPQTPTSVEQGIPSLLAFNWFAVMGPAGLPRPVVERLHKALNETIQTQQVRDALVANGIDPMGAATPETFNAFMREELQRWGVVARASGARAD
ncbi:tripartite tricarboxylate transporter substrate binding protein [Rhodoferax sp.]|uniref:Bug family tripartite tricarboxylate transporter substrate binding protein n=1 Tax=Rhodoferax sp. TaxID=50421 RepID=UPI002734C866|nr:tripartite tricarboxylate transporter substrate binding protein [Rhodoferax sp.]MDP3190260.1 tripartite tricarboxylate transporter substrate binding protein [Rhodoferax sp.]